jgi:predicted O-methyltransferase YrrM
MEDARSGIDAYLAKNARHDDPILLEMERIAAERKFPIVGPQVGRLLEVLARAVSARRVVELGSGFGYSASWFLRAVGIDGHVTLTDASAELCTMARSFLERGGFTGRYAIEIGDALDIAATVAPGVDVLFCDIDKHDYAKALPIAHRLVRVGGLFIADNMLWHGRVAAPGAADAATRGVLELTAALRASRDFVSALVPLRDGLSVSVRTR